jgi:putative spermidine/putrescine transport system permease protein
VTAAVRRYDEPSRRRRLALFFHRRPRAALAVLLAPPLGWLLIAYLGSLAILFINAFFRIDPFTTDIVRDPGLQNFERLATTEVYRTITLRTLGIATAVTVSTAVLAFPIAYYMARVASRRTRNLLVVGILMPLWASYLVKVYAWRVILAEDGILNWALAPIGLKGPGFGDAATWLVFTYLWLPYMILPIYAGLERIPSSLLEASSDLGARSSMTFRQVTLPLVFPAIVAGSIFTFSLTMGDFIAPQLVSSTQFIGNVIYANVGSSGDLPFAAAFATVPVAVMIVYLLVARRLGAFEALWCRTDSSLASVCAWRPSPSLRSSTFRWRSLSCTRSTRTWCLRGRFPGSPSSGGVEPSPIPACGVPSFPRCWPAWARRRSRSCWARSARWQCIVIGSSVAKRSASW